MLGDKLLKQVVGILQIFKKLLATAVGILTKHGQGSLVFTGS